MLEILLSIMDRSDWKSCTPMIEYFFCRVPSAFRFVEVSSAPGRASYSTYIRICIEILVTYISPRWRSRVPWIILFMTDDRYRSVWIEKLRRVNGSLYSDSVPDMCSRHTWVNGRFELFTRCSFLHGTVLVLIDRGNGPAIDASGCAWLYSSGAKLFAREERGRWSAMYWRGCLLLSFVDSSQQTSHSPSCARFSYDSSSKKTDKFKKHCHKNLGFADHANSLLVSFQIKQRLHCLSRQQYFSRNGSGQIEWSASKQHVFFDLRSEQHW